MASVWAGIAITGGHAKLWATTVATFDDVARNCLIVGHWVETPQAEGVCSTLTMELSTDCFWHWLWRSGGGGLGGRRPTRCAFIALIAPPGRERWRKRLKERSAMSLSEKFASFMASGTPSFGAWSMTLRNFFNFAGSTINRLDFMANSIQWWMRKDVWCGEDKGIWTSQCWILLDFWSASCWVWREVDKNR